MNDFLKSFKIQIKETLVRQEINFKIYELYGNTIRGSVKKELDNKKIYNPQIFKRLYFILLPTYIIQSNLILFFIFRKNTTLSKYMGIIFFNIWAINFFFMVLEKKIFFEYISKPNPCSKFMREEYFRLT
jgi:hypothetical protein